MPQAGGLPAARTTAGSTPSRSARWSRCRTSTSSSTRRAARASAKLDLATFYIKFRIGEGNQYKSLLRAPGGQLEFRVCAFGLQGRSSVLMRFMHPIFGRPELFSTQTGGPSPSPAGLAQAPRCWAVSCMFTTFSFESSPGIARSIWGTCVRCSSRSGITSSTPRHPSTASARICCSSFGFLGHVISARRAAVGPRKVAAAEWATRTSALACAASLATKIANLSYPIWPAVLMQVSNAGFCTRR